jgi:hypothetical protein
MAPPNPPFPPPLHCCTLIGKACSLPNPFLLLFVVITLLLLKQFRILRKWIVCLFWFDEFSRKRLLTIYENVHIGDLPSQIIIIKKIQRYIFSLISFSRFTFRNKISNRS